MNTSKAYRKFLAVFCLALSNTALATGGAGLGAALVIYLGGAVLFCVALGGILKLVFKVPGVAVSLIKGLGVALLTTFIFLVLISFLSTWWHQNISTNDRPWEIGVPLFFLSVWTGTSFWLIRKKGQ